jgi:DNA-binding IclR family transcriptional regulator
MTKSDDAILELLADSGLHLPPTVIAENCGVSKPTVVQRMPTLLKHELVEKTDEQKGYYQITGRGRAYLAGELEAQDLD